MFVFLFCSFIYFIHLFIIKIVSYFTLFFVKSGALSTNYKTYTRDELCNDFIQERIYAPRMEMLTAMKDGFNIVGISNHLMDFSSKDFEKYFVGLEIYTARDVINNLVFVSDNDHEIIQIEFKNVIEKAISKLGENHGKLMEFVKFISGSTILQPNNKLIITPIVYGSWEVPFWPDYPLPKAQTCFNKLFAPYLIYDLTSIVEEKEKEEKDKDKDEKNGEKNDVNEKNFPSWTVENVLKSFENILHFNKEAFSDN